MLLKISASILAFGMGYSFVYVVALRLFSANRLGPNFFGKKYLGFRSYRELRSYVIGANILWAPVISVASFCFLMQLGWDDAIWVCAFFIGYAMSFWIFLRRPKEYWDDGNGPA